MLPPFPLQGPKPIGLSPKRSLFCLIRPFSGSSSLSPTPAPAETIRSHKSSSGPNKKPKQSKGRFIVPMPEKVDQVAKDAYDRGELGAEMYEKLVQAGLHDMREPGVSEWKDTAAANAEVPPPPPPVDDYVKDYVGEYIEVPAPPLSPPTEDSSMDDWQPKEAPAPACAVEEILPEVEVVGEYPVDGATEGVEVQGDRGKEQVAKEEREAAGKEEEEEDWKGQGFLWCFGCGRVDVVRYGNKALSDYFKGASMEVESGIVFILCGSCRGTPARSWQAKVAIETSMGSSFQTLRLMPRCSKGRR